MISRKTTVSAAALLLASAGAAAAFPATAVTDLNVRSGPGTGYGVVDVLRDGDTVEVVARSGGWYQLANGGWASGNYLDAQGQTTVYVDRGYGYDYGPVAFYYDDDPFYWDNAGFYFFIRDGRRHRVGWDWFDRHDHRNFRWSNARLRADFERRRGGNWDNDRRIGRGDRDDDDDRGRRGGDWDRGDRSARGGDVRRKDGGMQSGRSSAESGAGADVGRGGQARGGGVGGEGNVRAGSGGEGGGGGGGGAADMRDVPGGGY